MEDIEHVAKLQYLGKIFDSLKKRVQYQKRIKLAYLLASQHLV